MKICKVNNCNKKHDAKGYCSIHYGQMRRYGKLMRKHKDFCSIETCNNKHHALGYCRKHYITISRKEHRGLYKEKNKYKIKNYSKDYRNKNKEKIKELCKAWLKNNKDKYLFYNSSRKATKLNATPTYADLNRMKDYYYMANMLNKLMPLDNDKWSVDHVIPLQGKNVCGFHIQTNLRVMPLRGNISKGNKLLMEEINE